MQDQIIDEIKKCNEDNNIHGIMIQKPLPKHINESEITLTIDPQKDMDAFHPVNIGNMVLDQKSFIPSTPAAVLEMIKYYQIKTTGKHVVVLGRSNIIGKPIANLLLRKNETGNATVTICHSRTRNLHSITQQADILIAAIGQPLFVKKDMIHDNVIILDVGVNQVEDAEKNVRYVGDVDYDDCYEKAAMITPVPGGVGTVTTALLLKNVLLSAKNSTLKRKFN